MDGCFHLIYVFMVAAVFIYCNKDFVFASPTMQDDLGDGFTTPQTRKAFNFQFVLHVSENSIKILGEQAVLDEFENFLQDNFMVNIADIFHLKLIYKSEVPTVEFTLQPDTKNISGIREAFDALHATPCSYKVCTFSIFGLELSFDYEYFTTTLVDWDGTKTVVHFEVFASNHAVTRVNENESKRSVVDFFVENFEIDLRQIYDIEVVATDAGNTRIGFSLPPAMDNIQTILDNIEVFVNNPCHEICHKNPEQTTFCSESCKAIRFSNIKAFAVAKSFETKLVEWTGNEIMFRITDEVKRNCEEHQESCADSEGKIICVGIGRCENYFYNTLEASVAIMEGIAIFDVLGIENTLQIIKEVLHDVYRLCKEGLNVRVAGHGRETTTLYVEIDPYITRTKDMQELIRVVTEVGFIQEFGLTVRVDKNSLVMNYLDTEEPLPPFIEKGCFGCTDDMVWCLLQDISLCLSKRQCIVKTIPYPRFAYDTDLVRVSFFLESDDDHINITKEFLEDVRKQHAYQLNCSLEYVDNLMMIRSDSYLYEVRLDLLKQKGKLSEIDSDTRDNVTLLEELVHRFHTLADSGQLKVNAMNFSMTSMLRSVVYKQLISGYMKTKQTKDGDQVVLACLLSLGVVFFTIVGLVAVSRIRRRCRKSLKRQ